MRAFRYGSDSGITDLNISLYDSSDSLLSTHPMPETSVSGIYRADVTTPQNADYGTVRSASKNIMFIFRLPYNETSTEITQTIKSDPSFSKLFSDADITALIEKGNWEIKANQMIFYDVDGITPILTFNLSDAAGNPTETQVYKRTLV